MDSPPARERAAAVAVAVGRSVKLPACFDRICMHRRSHRRDRRACSLHRCRVALRDRYGPPRGARARGRARSRVRRERRARSRRSARWSRAAMPRRCRSCRRCSTAKCRPSGEDRCFSVKGDAAIDLVDRHRRSTPLPDEPRRRRRSTTGCGASSPPAIAAFKLVVAGSRDAPCRGARSCRAAPTRTRCRRSQRALAKEAGSRDQGAADADAGDGAAREHRQARRGWPRSARWRKATTGDTKTLLLAAARKEGRRVRRARRARCAPRPSGRCAPIESAPRDGRDGRRACSAASALGTHPAARRARASRSPTA